VNEGKWQPEIREFANVSEASEHIGRKKKGEPSVERMAASAAVMANRELLAAVIAHLFR